MREKKVGRSAWLARLGAPRTAIPPCVPYVSLSVLYLRGICRAQRQPTAKCPRTSLSFLLPTLYFALLPTFFSLIPT